MAPIDHQDRPTAAASGNVGAGDGGRRDQVQWGEGRGGFVQVQKLEGVFAKLPPHSLFGTEGV
jgi:hypothetical protein